MKNPIQNKILEDLLKNKKKITLFTTNGVKVEGVIQRFDDYTIELKNATNMKYMIYKHAISTISY